MSRRSLQGAAQAFQSSMAMPIGTLFIALGLDSGSEARHRLGLAAAGGLVVSQSPTLFVTPVAYTYLEALQARLGQ